MLISTDYSKVNRANAQSARRRILFAQANGKLCFEYLKTFSVPENQLAPLPDAKGEMPPKSAFLLKFSTGKKQVGFSQKGGGLLSKSRRAFSKRRRAFQKR